MFLVFFPCCNDTAKVALWGSNAKSIDSERLIDAGSREPVVALVMGGTHKKHNFKNGYFYSIFLL
jgi:hypothetical protein